MKKIILEDGFGGTLTVEIPKQGRFGAGGLSDSENLLWVHKHLRGNASFDAGCKVNKRFMMSSLSVYAS